ncbi:MAG: hypothetical protein WC182_07025 [Bacilli bacterium]|nr:hypothetical protein [Sphaerochaetaceae bacterium]
MKFKNYGFKFPTAEFPYYHLELLLEGASSKLACEVVNVTVDGKRNRDFEVLNDGKSCIPPVIQPEAKEKKLMVRIDWSKGKSYTINIELKDSKDKIIHMEESFLATEENGYWNNEWKYYASHVIKETSGYDRVQEPVHVVFAVYKDRISNPIKEMRVVEIDTETGKATEIRSQVYGVSEWEKWQDIHCQPSTTIEIAFLADVPAKKSKVFLFFYGNSAAEKPSYDSDLKISGDGYALSVENSFYKVNLHKDNGSIDEIIPQQDPDILYCHHLETNGALQWNPGVYAPPKTWMHASDWVNPSDFTVIVGPVFVMIKRFNPIEDYEEVDCSLTYIFYSNNRSITVESNIDVNKELDVVALRNGSVVLNKETTGDFAWRDVDHELKTVHITDLPRHPVKGMVFDARTPWFAFYNKERGNALGVINLDFSGIRRSKGLVEWEPYFYLHWGPWFYVSRPIIYTFTSNNPQRVMHMSAGTSFYEKYKLLPFSVNKDDKKTGGFEIIDLENKKEREPLSIKMAKLDTDERVPDEWIPPILISHFEEMED